LNCVSKFFFLFFGCDFEITSNQSDRK